MNAPASSRKLLPAAKTTTVFTSGNSQAVRLPKEFRVSARTLEISRRGDEIVLRERPRTVGEVLADLPALSNEEAAGVDLFMKSVKASLPPLEERDFSWMNEIPSVRTKGNVKSLPSKSRTKKRV